MDCVHGILQASVLEWVAFPFSRGSSQPRDRTQVSCTAGRLFTSWATGKPKNTGMGSLSFLQRIFPTQQLNSGLLCCRQILYQLSHQGSHSGTLILPLSGPTIFFWPQFPPAHQAQCKLQGGRIPHCDFLLHHQQGCAGEVLAVWMKDGLSANLSHGDSASLRSQFFFSIFEPGDALKASHFPQQLPWMQTYWAWPRWGWRNLWFKRCQLAVM